jgi:NADH:ubiquinone oxidoreductase subunit 3 (subunit A)
VVFPNVLRDNAALKWIFYGEMMLFMVVLFIGLVYVWRKGILEWNR